MTTKCKKCGREMQCPACTGSCGGKAKVAKGFASLDLQQKAQHARHLKRIAEVIADDIIGVDDNATNQTSSGAR